MTAGVITLSLGALTDVGREREANEDAFLVADAKTGTILNPPYPPLDVGASPLLLAVSDGMGGENAGEIASALTLQTLRTAMASVLGELAPAAALRAAIGRANEAVTQAAAASRARSGMGATLVVALVMGGRALIATVGDSRAYVLRGGELVQVTKDQTFLQELIDSGEIAPEFIATFPHKNVILQAVGRAPALSIPVGQLDLRRGDRILLCSDGLTGEVPDHEIGRILARVAESSVACRELVDAANAHGGQDNTTVIVAHARGSGLAVPGPGDTVLRTYASLPEPNA